MNFEATMFVFKYENQVNNLNKLNEKIVKIQKENMELKNLLLQLYRKKTLLLDELIYLKTLLSKLKL